MGRVILSTWLLRSSPVMREHKDPTDTCTCSLPNIPFLRCHRLVHGRPLATQLSHLLLTRIPFISFPHKKWTAKCAAQSSAHGQALPSPPSFRTIAEWGCSTEQVHWQVAHNFNASLSVSLAKVLSSSSIWPKGVPQEPLGVSQEQHFNAIRYVGWESRPSSHVIHLCVPDLPGLAPERIVYALEWMIAVLHFPCQLLWIPSILNFIKYITWEKCRKFMQEAYARENA